MIFYNLILITTLIFSIGCKDDKEFKNEVNVAITSKLSSLDPAICFDTVCAEIVYQVHEQLYQYEYLERPYKVSPLLAESLPEISQDGLTYTIKLKKNVYYHPSKNLVEGRTVIAEDFINQIKRIAFIPTRSNGWWLFEGKIVGLDQFRKEAKDDFSNFFSYKIKGLKAINDHTLQIKLTKPFPQLLYAFAMAFSSPVPKEIIEATNNNLNEQVIGTGAFSLENWQRGLKVELAKFDKYRQVKYPSKGDRFAHSNNLIKDANKTIPFVNNVNFHIMEEAQTRWLNFLKNKIDFIALGKDHFNLALDNQGRLRDEFVAKNIKVQISPTLTYWWLAFNMNDQIVGKNLNLRKAIAHAVDISKLIKIFTSNVAQKANSIYPPGVPGYSPTNTLPYEYNLDKAKELLKLAGYSESNPPPTLNYDVRGSNQVSRQMGEFIAGELNKIGIKVNVIVNTFPGFLNKARTGQLQFWQGGWSMDYPDPENTLQLLIKRNHPPGPNTTYFTHPTIERLYKEIAIENRIEVNKPKYLEIEKIIHDNLPWVMQFYSRTYVLHHGRVKNYRHSDLIYAKYKYMRIQE